MPCLVCLVAAAAVGAGCRTDADCAGNSGTCCGGTLPSGQAVAGVCYDADTEQCCKGATSATETNATACPTEARGGRCCGAVCDTGGAALCSCGGTPPSNASGGCEYGCTVCDWCPAGTDYRVYSAEFGGCCGGPTAPPHVGDRGPWYCAGVVMSEQNTVAVGCCPAHGSCSSTDHRPGVTNYSCAQGSKWTPSPPAVPQCSTDADCSGRGKDWRCCKAQDPTGKCYDTSSQQCCAGQVGHTTSNSSVCPASGRCCGAYCDTSGTASCVSGRWGIEAWCPAGAGKPPTLALFGGCCGHPPQDPALGTWYCVADSMAISSCCQPHGDCGGNYLCVEGNNATAVPGA